MSWKMRQVRRCGRLRGLRELDFLVDKTPKIQGGQLLGYLFRRFGYPERGWDGYKEAGCYYLTTPDRRLVMEARATTSSNPSINITFYTTAEMHDMIDGEGARREWRKSMRAWFRENREYPPWFDEFVRWVGTQLDPPLPPDYEISAEDRECALFDHAVWFTGSPLSEKRPEIARRAGVFYGEVWNDFKKVRPWPKPPSRRGNWERWPDDDPLKELARAAQAALRELRRPVRVRDGGMNAYGAVDDFARGEWRSYAKEPQSAGYAPFGSFANADPKLACDLAGAVGAFGKNPRAAMKKALAVLRAAAPKPRKKVEEEAGDAEE